MDTSTHAQPLVRGVVPPSACFHTGLTSKQSTAPALGFWVPLPPNLYRRIPARAMLAPSLGAPGGLGMFVQVRERISNANASSKSSLVRMSLPPNTNIVPQLLSSAGSGTALAG